MAEPVQALADAIEAKDSIKFTKSYCDLSDRCNGCHQSMGRRFIIMRVPEVRLSLIDGLRRSASDDHRNAFIADGFIK